MINYIKDPWNGIHFLGSVVLAIWLFQKVIGDVRAFIAAFTLGVLWEGADALNKRYAWKLWFLDYRGADFRDIMVDLIGVLTAMWLLGV